MDISLDGSDPGSVDVALVIGIQMVAGINVRPQRSPQRNRFDHPDARWITWGTVDGGRCGEGPAAPRASPMDAPEPPCLLVVPNRVRTRVSTVRGGIRHVLSRPASY